MSRHSTARSGCSTIRRCAWLTLLMVTPAFAGTLPFDCASLEAVVAEAPTRFNRITGVTISQESEVELAASLGVPVAEVDRDYARRVSSSDTPMPGAKRCEVLDAWHGDADARISEIAHVCHYPGVSRLSADFTARLAECLARQPDPDADGNSVTFDIDTVASGEGYGHTQVIAEAQPVDGLRIAVVQTICEVRRLGGCDE